MFFANRQEAGRQLALQLTTFKRDSEAVAVGLARGGVIVAAEVGEALAISLDLIVVRKIGAPTNPELAIGAVTSEGEGLLNEELITMLGVSQEYLEEAFKKEQEIAAKRKALYFGQRQGRGFHEKVVILIDDGIATGVSMKVAILAIRAQKPRKIVLAVPVAPPDSLKEISVLVDEVVCLHSSSSFGAVGAFYREFPQVTDEEVIEILRRA